MYEWMNIEEFNRKTEIGVQSPVQASVPQFSICKMELTISFITHSDTKDTHVIITPK